MMQLLFLPALTATSMDSVFNTNNLVPDLVTVIAAEQCNRAAALPGRAGFSCCVHKPLLMGAVCLRDERLLLQETILRGARVPPQAQELLGRSGLQHCEPAHLCGGVAAFLTLMDPTPGLPGPLSLPHWEQGAGLEPLGQEHLMQARSNKKGLAQMCSCSHRGENKIGDPVFVVVLFWQQFGWNLLWA